MSCQVGPNIVEDGLFFAIDAANFKSYSLTDEKVYNLFEDSIDSENRISSVGYPFYYISASDASTLGFTYGPADVKGESDLLTACSGLLTFSEAVEFVHSIGARLPTQAEVLAAAATGSGCSYDAEYIWTCDKSNTDGTSHFCIYGDVSTYGSESISKLNTETAYVRYVADVDLNRLDPVEIVDAELESILLNIPISLNYSTTYINTYYIFNATNFQMLNGVTVTSGYFDFDGIDNYISLNDNFITTSKLQVGDNNYSIEAWVYVNSNPGDTTAGYSIIGHAAATGIGLQLMYNTGGVKVNFGYRTNSNYYSLGNLSLSNWYHIVCTRESGISNRIYINGNLDSTHPVVGTLDIDAVTESLEIGYATSRVTGRFDGRIAVVKLYNSFLTDEKVKQNFETHRGRFNI